MENTPPSEPRGPLPGTNGLPPSAPLLMMGFWALLGAAAGINIAQSIWRLLGFDVGKVTIAVPVGAGIGAVAGALLGRIRHPRLLIMLMAVFAGSAAGAVAGKVAWGPVGEIGGQVAGGLVGGIAWATWLYFAGKTEKTEE